MAPILLLAAFLNPTLSDSFDGLTLADLKPVGNPEVRGPLHFWDIQDQAVVDGKKVVVGSTSVAVTELAGIKTAVTPALFCDMHEQRVRTLPVMVAANIARYDARFGDAPAVLTLGSALAIENGKPGSPIFVSSVAAMVGTKVYEVVRLSTSGPAALAHFEAFRAAAITTGEKEQALTGLPSLFSSHFTARGLPFAMDWEVVPIPILTDNLDGFEEGYSAWGSSDACDVSIEARKLAPGTTFDLEGFVKAAFIHREQAKTVVISDVVKAPDGEEWTAKVALTMSDGRILRGTIHIHKEGEWVAAQLLKSSTDIPNEVSQKFKIVQIKGP